MKYEANIDILLKFCEIVWNTDIADGSLKANHPAIKFLCNYWNSRKDIPSQYRVAKGLTIEFLNEDNLYQNIDPDVPPQKLEDLPSKNNILYLGNNFIIIFFSEELKVKNGNYHLYKTYLVDGSLYKETFGLDPENPNEVMNVCELEYVAKKHSNFMDYLQADISKQSIIEYWKENYPTI